MNATDRELLIVTGMSGAGRSTAANSLEDQGWYVVDNLPIPMLSILTDMVARFSETLQKLAVVVDVRGGHSLGTDLHEALEELRRAGLNFRVLFLDASDEALVRRFELARRPHPLQGQGTTLDGITAERQMLRGIKSRAETVMDTSEKNVHELSAAVNELFNADQPVTVKLTIMSFGFKYGLPMDANFVADMRFIPNPHWIPELRPKTGKDPEVADYVLGREGVDKFLDNFAAAMVPVLQGYRVENKHYATLAVGCTGGKHRSVATSLELARRLSSVPGVMVTIKHRDLGRE